MLEVASNRDAPASSWRVEFQQADAQVAQLGRASFDDIFSPCGVMFFSDPLVAFSNLHRALQPNGRLAFVWRRPVETNPRMAEPLNAARPYLPPRAPVDPTAMGVFTFSCLDQNRDKIRAVSVKGVDVSLGTISSGKHPISRPLFIYVKRAHVGVIPGLAEFVSDRAAGKEGYLADKGLIPMPAQELKAQQTIAKVLSATH